MPTAGGRNSRRLIAVVCRQILQKLPDIAECLRHVRMIRSQQALLIVEQCPEKAHCVGDITCQTDPERDISLGIRDISMIRTEDPRLIA